MKRLNFNPLIFTAAILFALLLIGIAPCSPILTNNEKANLSAPNISEGSTNLPPIIGQWDFEGTWDSSTPGAPSVSPFAAQLENSGGLENSGYLRIPNASAYATIPSNDSYAGTGISIEFWVREPSLYESDMNLLYKTNGVSGQYNYRVLQKREFDGIAGDLEAGYYSNDDSAYHSVGASSISLSYWHQLVIVIYENALYFYKDGSLEGYVSGYTPTSGDSDIYLGDPFINQALDIDHVVIFNGTLTDQMVNDLYMKHQLTAQIYAETTQIELGQTVTFSGNLTHGGMPPYTFNWTVEYGETQEFYPDMETLVETFNSPGYYYIYLDVSDSYGATSYDMIEVVVTPQDDYLEENDQWTDPAILDPYNYNEYFTLVWNDADYYGIYISPNDGLEIRIWAEDGYSTEDLQIYDVSPADGSIIREAVYNPDYNDIRLSYPAADFDRYIVILVNSSRLGIYYDIRVDIIFGNSNQPVGSVGSEQSSEQSSDSDGQAPNPLEIDAYPAHIIMSISLIALIVIYSRTLSRFNQNRALH